MHSEVCFWAFSGEEPMRAWKKRREDREERLRLLRKLDKATDTIVDAALDRFLRMTAHPEVGPTGAKRCLTAFQAIRTIITVSNRCSRAKLWKRSSEHGD